ncbi:unnamed protein product [Effrenium voratum]|nr:unnamed protein product [Effrenium voratum]|mmetsp:Transcript_85139/g.204035  ORF Transcript_85139/g.204035 Transcript_85139/m.204035 type:complete len:237 (-) Transcript_85139:183-893(-)
MLMRQIWPGLASFFAVAFADGELVAATECNPYQGTRYITLGNGDSITSAVCEASWDLHELSVFDEFGFEITSITASAPTGSSSPTSDYGPQKALDGSLTTFWAGDHDIGASCSCWDDFKKDSQQILLDLKQTYKVSKINIWQGGAGNKWAISKLRIHCHSAGLVTNPVELEISSGSTTVECDDAGCRAIDHNPAFVHRSAACAASTAGQLGVPVGLLLGLGLVQRNLLLRGERSWS